MEELLRGGFVTTVVRIGATLRRPPSPNAAFVHDLTAGTPWPARPRWSATTTCPPGTPSTTTPATACGCSATATAWTTAPTWSTRSSGGRTAADGASESGAAAGDPPWPACATVAAAGLRAAHAWAAANQAMLEAALTSDGTRRRAAV